MSKFCPSQGSTHHVSAVHPFTLSLHQEFQLRWFIYFAAYCSQSRTLLAAVTYCTCVALYKTLSYVIYTNYQLLSLNYFIATKVKVKLSLCTYGELEQ